MTKTYFNNKGKKMKIITTTLMATTLAFSQVAFANASLTTPAQKASYTLGVDLAKNFNKQGIKVDTDALVAGMNDVLKKQKLQLTDAEMHKAIEDVKKIVIQKQMAAQKVIAESNAAKGAKFLSENKKKKGVKVLPNGLQYIVLTKGKGKFATADDFITVHYRGTLINGTEFDSSYKRGAPIEFKMSNVIKGWREALKKMKPGSKWKIFVPPALAYGERGAGGTIGPNETLIFDIDLISTSKTKPLH